MSKYLTVAFADLERHSQAWARVPREQMVAAIAEYRYLAESLAGQYGCHYLEWAGDGHMFMFENADSAVRFGLQLVEHWRRARGEAPALARAPDLPVRFGCHFGECTPVGDGDGWIGRGNAIAKRVESEAEPDSVFVSEAVLDLIDLPLYDYEPAGARPLKGDHLAERVLYRVLSFDRAALSEKPPAELDADDWFLKGVALIGTAEEWGEEEIACYRKALELRPDHAAAHNNLAILLRRAGDEAQAARHYQEALRLRPDYPEAHYNYASLLAAKGRYAGAADHLREALDARPEYVAAHQLCATVLQAQGAREEAQRHFSEALRLRPDDPEGHNNYAVLLEALGRRDEAAAHYREALRLRPGYAEAHYNFALLLEETGDAAATERHYREALRIWPDYGEAHNNLAILLQLRGDLVSAEHHYREALRVRPADPESHYNLGLLLRAQGELEAATHHFRMAAELAPDVAAFRSALESPS